MSEFSDQEPLEGGGSSGPGYRLREARESRQLTLEQAATQLRMQVRIIEALEKDDFSTLPGSTFVQGYLRSYSRLLGLPEENIVALAQLGSGETSSIVSSIDQGKVEVSSRDLPMRLITILIVATVLVGLGWWLSQREPAIDRTQPEVVLPGAEQALSLPAVTSDMADESSVADSLDSGTEPQAEVEEIPGESEAALQQTEVEASEPEVVPITSLPAPVPAAETTAPAPSPLTAQIPQSVVVLEYQQDSWSEITDAAGRKLAYGLIPAEKRLELRGEAPFRIFLGYAPGVTVYYNGDLYDHTPFQRNDVARFRIGRAEHNRPVSGN